MRRRFLNDVSWFSVAQLLSGLVMLAYIMVAARLLGSAGGVETYGLFQSVMGLYSIVFVLGFSLNVTTIHIVGVAARKDRSAAVGTCLVLALVVGGTCAGAILVASPLLASMLRSDSTAPIVATAVLVAMAFVLTVFYGGLQGCNQYRRFAVAKISETGLAFVLGTVLMALGGSVTGAVGGYVCGMGVVTLVFLAQRSDYRFVPGAVPLRRELQTVALPLVVSAVLFFSLAGPMLVARWRLDENTSGLFAALFSFRNVLQPFALAVSLPLYSRIVTNRGEAGMLCKALAVVTLLAGGFIAVSVICPQICIRMVLGTKFIPAADYLWAYAIALGLFMVGMVVMFHAVAHRYLRLYLLPIPAAAVIAMAVWPELTIGKIIGLQVVAWMVFLLTQTVATLTDVRRLQGKKSSVCLLLWWQA